MNMEDEILRLEHCLFKGHCFERMLIENDVRVIFESNCGYRGVAGAWGPVSHSLKRSINIGATLTFRRPHQNIISSLQLSTSIH